MNSGFVKITRNQAQDRRTRDDHGVGMGGER